MNLSDAADRHEADWYAAPQLADPERATPESLQADLRRLVELVREAIGK